MGEEGGGAGGVVSYSLAEATGTVSSDIFMVWVVGILGILDWSGGESGDEYFFGQLEMKAEILANGIWRRGSCGKPDSICPCIFIYGWGPTQSP